MGDEKKRKVPATAAAPRRARPADHRPSYFILAGPGAPWLKLRVTEVGESFWQRGKNCSRRHSDRLAWEMVVAGRMRLVQDGRSSAIGPGEAFILRRGVAHSYHAEGGDARKIYVGLDGEVAEALLQDIGDRVVLPDPAAARRRFATLRSLFTGQPDGWHAQASCLAYALLVDCQAAASRGHRAERPRHPAVRAVVPLLESGQSRTRSIADIASRSGISTAQLYRLFRREYATTPQRYARAHHLRAIKRCLADGDEAIQDVARQFGYGDPAYFATWFKRETGASPSHFRRRNREA